MNEKDLARYWAIIQRHMAGQPLSKEDNDFFVKYLPYVDETRMKRIIEQGVTGGFSPEDVDNAIQQMTVAQITKPEYKQKLMDFASTKEAGRVAGNVRNAVNTALAAVDIGLSASQISNVRNELRKSRRPQRPAPLTKDPTLQAELGAAQQETLDAARAVSPAQQAILDNYMSDLNQARTASTGQAGVYGALGQVASTRRARASQQLAPVVDTIRARRQARLNDLLRMNQAENMAIQQSQAQFYPTDQMMYLREQQGLGGALAQGRQNLRGALTNIAAPAVEMTAQNVLRKRSQDAYNKLSAMYGQEIGKLAADGYSSLYNVDPNTQAQFEEMYGYQYPITNRG
jgi:hypothetical protein